MPIMLYLYTVSIIIQNVIRFKILLTVFADAVHKQRPFDGTVKHFTNHNEKITPNKTSCKRDQGYGH